ncbi:hypothetical protein Plhal703r1_c04g0023791 [Plasmopara halstedii]
MRQTSDEPYSLCCPMKVVAVILPQNHDDAQIDREIQRTENASKILNARISDGLLLDHVVVSHLNVHCKQLLSHIKTKVPPSTMKYSNCRVKC